MAKQPASPTYDPAAEYRVELSRVVKFDGLRLRGEIILTGEAIERLIGQEGAGIVLSADKL